MAYTLEMCVRWSFHSKVVDLMSNKPAFHTVEFKENYHAHVFGKAIQSKFDLLQIPCKVFVVGERVNIVDSETWQKVFEEI